MLRPRTQAALYRFHPRPVHSGLFLQCSHRSAARLCILVLRCRPPAPIFSDAEGAMKAVTAVLLGAFSIICLLFFVEHVLGRETAPDLSGPTKPCPACAEQIQAKARKCMYCGASLAPP